MRNAVGTQAVGECFHSFFEFSQTFTSVSISFRKQPKENNRKRRKLDSFIYHQNIDLPVITQFTHHNLINQLRNRKHFLCFYRVIET